ncbi:MAG: EthD family reductase [Anaerolineales bacterium]|nr:EthD family reductase [Anaerolineales bacterium]
MKLIAIYDQPDDPDAFDEAYFGTHLPLLQKVPGLERTEVTRFTRTVMGEGKYMMAVMHFKDADALKEGMRSSEMQAAGENLNSFAEGLVSLMYGQPEDV